uniref:2-iminobutanoate/2-iminopropanoate deaminase n=1 Tax=Monopterus albus TaxID=43700 RepID=A0A3Q3IV89_MONAL
IKEGKHARTSQKDHQHCISPGCYRPVQSGSGCGQNHVHLRSAGAGRGLWSAGRWRSAGPGQTVVKTTVLLADINDFNSVNEVYKTFFSSNFPARAAYQVAALPRGGLVEIEAIAVLGPLTDS